MAGRRGKQTDKQTTGRANGGAGWSRRKFKLGTARSVGDQRFIPPTAVRKSSCEDDVEVISALNSHIAFIRLIF
jgi:hypothetical protein